MVQEKTEKPDPHLDTLVHPNIFQGKKKDIICRGTSVRLTSGLSLATLDMRWNIAPNLRDSGFQTAILHTTKVFNGHERDILKYCKTQKVYLP